MELNTPNPCEHCTSELEHFKNCFYAQSTCLTVAHKQWGEKWRAKRFLASGWRRLAKKKRQTGP